MEELKETAWHLASGLGLVETDAMGTPFGEGFSLYFAASHLHQREAHQAVASLAEALERHALEKGLQIDTRVIPKAGRRNGAQAVELHVWKKE